MDIQVPEITGNAYTRLREFLDQDDSGITGDDLGFYKNAEDMPDYQQAQRLDARIDDHVSIVVEIERALEIFSWREIEEVRPYVLALMEHLDDNTGFVPQSAAQIAEDYNSKFDANFIAEDLEKIRRKLRDEGAILGMYSKDSQEFRHLLVGTIMKRRPDGKLLSEFTPFHLKRIQYVLKMESDGHFDMLELYGLADHLAKIQVQPRQFTANVVKRILRCKAARAKFIFQAYKLLPEAPCIR